MINRKSETSVATAPNSMGKSKAFILIRVVNRIMRVAILTVALSGCTMTPKTTLTADDSGTFSFPANSYWKGKNVNPVGTLKFPENVEDKVPLVILVHGTGGVGYRESTWLSFLRDHGIATFVLDYFAPRNVKPRDRDIPQPPQDVWGALKILATHPRIDNDRVAIMGFSNGATITLISSGYLSTSDTGAGSNRRPTSCSTAAVPGTASERMHPMRPIVSWLAAKTR